MVALAVGLSASGAHAAPATPAASPADSSAALAQMRTLYQQFATLSESYQEAEVTLGTRQREAVAATLRAHAAAVTAESHRGRIRTLVRAEARSTPFGTLGAMVSSDSPGQFAARVSLIDAVAARRAAAVAEAARASAAAAAAANRARTAVTAADRLARDLRARRADLKGRADRAAALFHRLSAAERQALTEAQTNAAAARASRASQRTAAAPTPSPSTRPSTRPSTAPPAAPPTSVRPTSTPPRSTPPPATTTHSAPPPPAPAPSTPPPASSRAGVAVQTARAQIGDPYVWGATGPDAFDCSGLTSYSWKAAGVILPRTSREQYAAGVKVARSALQPGDLVYFGSPIYHVAIYVGNNTMISAPQPGDVVKYQSLDAFSDYAGATRPG